MKFRIHCTNPRTRQRHEFDLDEPSLHDVQSHLREAGLVPTQIDPLPSTRTRWKVMRPLRWAPAPPPTRRVRTVSWAVFGLGVAAVVLTALLTGGGPPAGHARLNAHVDFDGYQLKITNHDDVDWRDTIIDVNGTLAHSGYRHKAGTISPGATIALPGSVLVDDKGRRYNPITEPPDLIRISADIGREKDALYWLRIKAPAPPR